ncbi:hypothetical protein D3C78_1372820 [compost metagenome]
MKAQGVEAVEHRVAAHLAAIEGLDADDGDDQGGGHSIGLLGPGQHLGVTLPEADPVADPVLGHEQRAVAVPGLGLPGPAYGIEDLLAQLRLGGGGLQLGQRHGLLLCQPLQSLGLRGCTRRQRPAAEHPAPSHQASNLLWV